jgi:FkbM family methyltransferase
MASPVALAAAGIVALLLVLNTLIVFRSSSSGAVNGADTTLLEARMRQVSAELNAFKKLSKTQSGSGGSSGHATLVNRQGKDLPLFLPTDDERVRVKEVNLSVTYEKAGKSESIDIFVMGTSSNPPFAAALANPRGEAASMDVFKNGDMEKPTLWLFEFLLNKKCAAGRAAGNPPKVLDAGANLGFFSTYSAVMGCDVMSVEMQPRLIPIIKMGPYINGVSDRSTVYNAIVNDDPDARIAVQYAAGACWGCSTARMLKKGDPVPPGTDVVRAKRLDTVAKDDLLLFKVDVEGYEVIAIESAMPTIENKKVSNILVEWAPGRWPHSIERGSKLLEKLFDLGYVIRHYNMRFHLPMEMVTVEDWPLVGKTFRLDRENLSKMNNHLKTTRGYGEANLWISLDHPIQKK